ncbi:hypothetical protein D3C72_1708850 [compost metagenome]
MATGRTLDVAGDDFQQLVASIMAQAVVDALEVIDIQKHDRQHAAMGAFLDEFFGEDLIEAATVDQVGQGIVVRHLLQRHACLIQLAEQCVDPAQVVFFVLQLFVGQGRADATAGHQQGNDGNGQPKLHVVVVHRLQRW